MSNLVLVRLETPDELTGSPKSDTFSSIACCMSSGWMKLLLPALMMLLVLPPMFRWFEKRECALIPRATFIETLLIGSFIMTGAWPLTCLSWSCCIRLVRLFSEYSLLNVYSMFMVVWLCFWIESCLLLFCLFDLKLLANKSRLSLVMAGNCYGW